MIPEGKDFDLDSFLSHVVEHKESMLEGRTRNELKVYLFLVNRPWTSFFENFEHVKQGALETLVVSPRGNMKKVPEEYYTFKLNENVAVVFSFATKENFERFLKKTVRTQRGITELWIRPLVCRRIRESILEKYPETQIRYFVARRDERDFAPCELRPEHKRRISYTGLDGRHVLEEVEHAYGVHPTSIHFDVRPGLELKVYEDGLIILRTINRETVDLMLDLIEMIVEDSESSRVAAFEMKSEIKFVDVDGGQIKVPQVLAGEILLPRNKLDVGVAESLVRDAKGFSFLDVIIEEGSLIFSATVVDEDKGTVFGLSASEEAMTLVPRYNSTFETFLRFRRHVAETVDSEALLVTGQG